MDLTQTQVVLLTGGGSRTQHRTFFEASSSSMDLGHGISRRVKLWFVSYIACFRGLLSDSRAFYDSHGTFPCRTNVTTAGAPRPSAFSDTVGTRVHVAFEVFCILHQRHWVARRLFST